MFFAQQNTFSVYEILDDAHRAASLTAPYYDMMGQLFDDRYFTPPYMPWLKGFPPLLRARRLHAMRYKMLHRYTRAYEKPAFGIETVEVDGKPREVIETVIADGPFCAVRKFETAVKTKEKLLLVAPMAGHYATLLRETVRALTPHFEVYITDWKNARDVPMSEGGFDISDYAFLLIGLFRDLGPALNVVGICQAGVPLTAALAMAEADGEADALPKSVTIMGAPIDTRCSPTKVNALATTKSADWFEDRMICTVPPRYPGAHRAVYPGFLQLTAFVMMNPAHHQKSMAEGVRAFVKGEFEKEDKVENFYEEFFSVMDLPAEFYLQTVDSIFMKQKLAKGDMVLRGRPVDLTAIRKTPIFAIEAEKDDITGLGQTKAVLDLATSLKDGRKRYFQLDGAGHYGLFNGARFRGKIVPEIRAFVSASGKPA